MSEETIRVRIFEKTNLDRLSDRLSSICFLLAGASIMSGVVYFIYSIVCIIFQFKIFWIIPLVLFVITVFIFFTYFIIMTAVRFFMPSWSKKILERYEVTEKKCPECNSEGEMEVETAIYDSDPRETKMVTCDHCDGRRWIEIERKKLTIESK
ncbi:hypothetical protein JW977_00325 [Candidatus Falkowbacteria bacterium]|nr:hypothetical protein [Candidatus Falkowbacteria bacterium]